MKSAISITLPEHDCLKQGDGNDIMENMPRPTVLVTHRRSKQRERPRNHKCKHCGREFKIDLRK